LSKDSPNPKLKEIETLARDKKIPFFRVDNREMSRLDPEHRGAIAQITPVKLHEEEEILQFPDKYKKILFAVNIEDPHNLGAILRTALAFGIDAVAISSRNGVSVNSTVISTSAGAAFKNTLVRVANTTNFIEKAKKAGYWIYGSNVKQDKTSNIHEIIFDDKSVILVGNEGKGLSDKILKHCDFTVHIPVKFESLNVSVATGIILSQLLKTN